MSIINYTEVNAGLFAQENTQQLFKQHLKQNDEFLKRQFDPQQPVTKLISAKADHIDRVLAHCWNHFLGQYGGNFSLLAVGGYGRRG